MPTGQGSRDTWNSYTWLQINNTGEGQTGYSGQGIFVHCTFTENKGLNRGLSTECWDIQHIPVLPKMLVFKLIFPGRKIEIFYFLRSLNWNILTVIQNKQKCPIRLLCKTQGLTILARKRASIYFSFFFFP